MADITITADQQGAYEIQLTPRTVKTIDIVPVVGRPRAMQLMVHKGTAPVYVAPGANVAVADPRSVMVAPATWADIPVSNTPSPTVVSIAIISDADAMISVYRA